jgi:hypothetical protein
LLDNSVFHATLFIRWGVIGTDGNWSYRRYHQVLLKEWNAVDRKFPLFLVPFVHTRKSIPMPVIVFNFGHLTHVLAFEEARFGMIRKMIRKFSKSPGAHGGSPAAILFD